VQGVSEVSGDSASSSDKAESASSKRRWRKFDLRLRPFTWKRYRWWLTGAGVGLPCSILALWFAVHRFEWMGPLVANTLRAVIGSENVTKLEDFVYAVEDRWNRFSRSDDEPKAYWNVPQQQPKPKPAPSAEPGAPPLPPFAPKDPGPAHKSWSAPGDGKWVAIVDPRRPNEPTYMVKTLLHPDASRSWAELFVVAIDLRRTRIHLMAGSQEPKADNEATQQSYVRPAKIPPEHHEELLAGFNGGFMTEHGGWGMHLDDTTLVQPREKGCTVAVYKDDSVRIATWARLKDTVKEMRWYRQGPECMYEDGKLHVGLTVEDNRKWGATLDGDTVIRRSAMGINEARGILYVGISNHTTARVMAEGMRHVGAPVVVQMDVNWSYPKFVLFEPRPGAPERKAVALAPGFEFSEDEYIRSKARRDFFYVMRRDRGSETAAK
jgi:hypothetical protein